MRNAAAGTGQQFSTSGLTSNLSTELNMYLRSPTASLGNSVLWADLSRTLRHSRLP